MARAPIAATLGEGHVARAEEQMDADDFTARPQIVPRRCRAIDAVDKSNTTQ
jgi:hypothetical protein